jgi:hypothetical protein
MMIEGVIVNKLIYTLTYIHTNKKKTRHKRSKEKKELVYLFAELVLSSC